MPPVPVDLRDKPGLRLDFPLGNGGRQRGHLRLLKGGLRRNCWRYVGNRAYVMKVEADALAYVRLAKEGLTPEPPPQKFRQ